MPHETKYDRPFAASVKLVETVDELLRGAEVMDKADDGKVGTVAVVLTVGLRDRLLRLCKASNKELHP